VAKTARRNTKRRLKANDDLHEVVSVGVVFDDERRCLSYHGAGCEAAIQAELHGVDDAVQKMVSVVQRSNVRFPAMGV
jgi:hypothetical protein